MIDYHYYAGALVGDPKVSYSPNGVAVTSFTIAQSDSKKNDAGEWETTDNVYLRVSVWDNDRHAYSNILTALNTGDKLVVHGKLITRKWKDERGKTRYQTEIQARDVYIHVASGMNTQQTAGAQDRRGAFEPYTQGDDAPPF